MPPSPCDCSPRAPMAATPLLPPLLARRPPTRLPPLPTARRRLAATREWGSSAAVASAIWISWADYYHERCVWRCMRCSALAGCLCLVPREGCWRGFTDRPVPSCHSTPPAGRRRWGSTRLPLASTTSPHPHLPHPATVHPRPTRRPACRRPQPRHPRRRTTVQLTASRRQPRATLGTNGWREACFP